MWPRCSQALSSECLSTITRQDGMDMSHFEAVLQVPGESKRLQQQSLQPLIFLSDLNYIQWNLGIRDTQGTVKNCPEF